jgi:hypothetical protein
MYELPIEIRQTSTQYTTIFDEEKDLMIFKAIQGVGVNVDKEELLKALKYDRQQYQKGYQDGIKDFMEAFKIKFAKERYRDNYVIDDEMLDNLAEEMGCG